MIKLWNDIIKTYSEILSKIHQKMCFIFELESKIVYFSMEIPRRDSNCSSIYKSNFFFVQNCQMFFDQTLEWHSQDIFWNFERNPTKDVFYFWARVKNRVLFYGNTKKRFKLFFDLQKQFLFCSELSNFLWSNSGMTFSRHILKFWVKSIKRCVLFLS